jgi:hypothetical protein
MTQKTHSEPKAYDATTGVCPVCNEPVQMYLPPERFLLGPKAYPALLLHFETSHPQVQPPAPPLPTASKGGVAHDADSWNPAPPAPADWRPLDRARAERRLPQPAGVWPPVHVAEGLDITERLR